MPDRNDIQQVAGGVINGFARRQSAKSVKIIAEAPWQRDPRKQINPHSALAFGAPEISRLGIVIGVHQAAEKILAAADDRVGQALQGKFLGLN